MVALLWGGGVVVGPSTHSGEQGSFSHSIAIIGLQKTLLFRQDWLGRV